MDAFEATSKDAQTVTDTPRMHQFPDVSSRKLMMYGRTNLLVR